MSTGWICTALFVISVLMTAGIIWAKKSRCKNYSKSLCGPEDNEDLESEVQAIREGIKNNEFILYYQPKISTETGEVAGAEALIRWEHPQKGIVSPDYFISIAEKTGLILEIGNWALKEACMQNKNWQDKGYNKFSVAVNISALEFYQKNMPSMVKKVLDETGLEPRYLEIELTESMALIDKEQAVAKMNEIKALGVKIAMDDFGTGYSSLSYLKELPIDVLKLDRSFIVEIENDKRSRAIISSMIKLARLLGIITVAEGVESPMQAELLTDMGCDMIQGYYYSKPVPADVFESLIENLI